MVISFSKMEAAKILGLSTIDIDKLCRAKVFHSWYREERDGRYSYQIDAEEVLEYARQRDGEHYLSYIRPCNPKRIVVKDILELPNEWYDDDYHKVMTKLNKLYEQQKIDDMY
jgi:hypothetical protein